MSSKDEKAIARLRELLEKQPAQMEATFASAVVAAANIYVLDMQLNSHTTSNSYERLEGAVVVLRTVLQALGKPTIPPEGR